MPPNCGISPNGFGRDDVLVDAEDAVFEAVGDAPDAADVAAVEIGGGPLPWGCGSGWTSLSNKFGHPRQEQTRQ
jgi:hypothetical protein